MLSRLHVWICLGRITFAGHGLCLRSQGANAHQKKMNKVILADNQGIFRAGTAKILAMEDDFRVIAQCPDSDRLYQAIDAFHGAVVMFAATLKPNLKELMERLSSAGSCAIAILENNHEAQPFLEAGVSGLVYRNVSGPVLVDCVRHVAGGERFEQPAENGAAEDLVGARVRDILTAKEMKMIGLLIQGCRNKEIAVKLGTTEQVVKNYMRTVYDKTGVSDRLELALFTLHHRILAEAAEAVCNPAVEVMA